MSENRQETKKNKKRSTIARVLLAIVIILALLFGYRCSVEYSEKKNAENVPPALEYEENVDAITEIDMSQRQEAVDTQVKDGMMNVNYSPNAVFEGKVSTSFNVKNIKNNHGPIVFAIMDENKECIYQSKMIAPGHEMKCIELMKELEKGTHDCTIQVKYAQEGSVATTFPLTIEVK